MNWTFFSLMVCNNCVYTRYCIAKIAQLKNLFSIVCVVSLYFSFSLPLSTYLSCPCIVSCANHWLCAAVHSIVARAHCGQRLVLALSVRATTPIPTVSNGTSRNCRVACTSITTTLSRLPHNPPNRANGAMISLLVWIARLARCSVK